LIPDQMAEAVASRVIGSKLDPGHQAEQQQDNRTS
jgi:hypothetical protein